MMNLNSPVSYLDQASLNRIADKHALDSYLRKQQEDYKDADFRMMLSPKVRQNLWPMIRGLDEIEQEIIHLRYWEDLTLHEIGRKTRMEERAVKKLLTTTLAKLKSKIMARLMNTSIPQWRKQRCSV
ncbi:MAG: hypothetical protein HYW48_12050 [Deltaproteobacteria bacterium]|nr:hypothetical protein [Deltaproteobacteria bacterium]